MILQVDHRSIEVQIWVDSGHLSQPVATTYTLSATMSGHRISQPAEVSTTLQLQGTPYRSSAPALNSADDTECKGVGWQGVDRTRSAGKRRMLDLMNLLCDPR